MSKRIEVVFTQDVEQLAKRGEQKVVAGGYWRNYLWPRGLAVLAKSKEARKLVAVKEAEQPSQPVQPPAPSTPKAKEEKKSRRVVRKEVKKEKEVKKSARLRSKVASSKPRAKKGKEKK